MGNGGGRGTQIIKQLTTPEELSGLLNLVLDKLAILIKDGISQDFGAIRNEWERNTDNVSAFCIVTTL